MHAPRASCEFEELLRRYWWNYDGADRPVPGRLRVPARAAARTRRSAALRNRARLLRAVVETHRFAIASDFMRKTKPTHVAWMFELIIDRLEVEIAWCERIATRIEGGAPLFPEGFVVDRASR